MLIIFGIAFIALIIIGWVIDYFLNLEGWCGGCLSIICGTALIIGIIAAICMINDVAEGKIIDEKIVIYEQENEKIETALDVLVKEYMTQEEKIMIKTANKESLITLVQLYPDLKSNNLVQKQMDIYVNNNKKIKNLKTEKLNISKSKWWLYFGK